MNSKVILLLVLFTHCKLNAMQEAEDLVQQTQQKLAMLIKNAQEEIDPFISSGQMSSEQSTALTQLTLRIAQQTQVLDDLITKIRAVHSSKNPIPKICYKSILCSLEATARDAEAKADWGICYKNETARNYSASILFLKRKLWETDKLFTLDSQCAITPIEWRTVTNNDYPYGGYQQLIGKIDNDNIPSVVFVKFTEGNEERAQFKMRSLSFYLENNLGPVPK